MYVKNKPTELEQSGFGNSSNKFLDAIFSFYFIHTVQMLISSSS